MGTDHAVYGVEPICAVWPIAPSVSDERTARERDPPRQLARAQRAADRGAFEPAYQDRQTASAELAVLT